MISQVTGILQKSTAALLYQAFVLYQGMIVSIGELLTGKWVYGPHRVSRSHQLLTRHELQRPTFSMLRIKGLIIPYPRDFLTFHLSGLAIFTIIRHGHAINTINTAKNREHLSWRATHSLSQARTVIFVVHLIFGFPCPQDLK